MARSSARGWLVVPGVPVKPLGKEVACRGEDNNLAPRRPKPTAAGLVEGLCESSEVDYLVELSQGRTEGPRHRQRLRISVGENRRADVGWDIDAQRADDLVKL